MTEQTQPIEQPTAPGPAPVAPYTVKLPVFEGPLDLLLHLIERQELDITAVSLAKVADQFLLYLQKLPRVQAGVIADFLVVAARLLLIKSRWLLPRPPSAEEEDEEDPGEILARRLREYKRFKEAAGFLGQLQQQHRYCYLRVAPPPPLETRLDLEGLTLADLAAALRQVVAEEPQMQPVDPLISPRKVTVREKIDLIQQLIQGGQPVPFRRVVAGADSRLEVVVSLWAVLELIKLGRLHAHQPQLFGEIILVERKQALQPTAAANGATPGEA